MTTQLPRKIERSWLDNATTIPLAVIAGAVLIAVAIVFIFRWEVVTVAYSERFFILRVDRWTGKILICSLKDKSHEFLCLDD
jgi:hypothetical protein